MNLLIFALGLFVGTLFGILVFSLCFAAKTGDSKMPESESVHLAQCRNYDASLSVG